MIMNTKKQNEVVKDRELFQHYAEGHPETKEFISALNELSEAGGRGRKSKITISIGKSKDGGFSSYLTSSIDNPRMIFSSWKENGTATPQVVISDPDGIHIIACFTMDAVKILSSDFGGREYAGCPFIMHRFVASIDNMFDYSIKMVIDNK